MKAKINCSNLLAMQGDRTWKPEKPCWPSQPCRSKKAMQAKKAMQQAIKLPQPSRQATSCRIRTKIDYFNPLAMQRDRPCKPKQPSRPVSHQAALPFMKAKRCWMKTDWQRKIAVTSWPHKTISHASQDSDKSQNGHPSQSTTLLCEEVNCYTLRLVCWTSWLDKSNTTECDQNHSNDFYECTHT